RSVEDQLRATAGLLLPDARSDDGESTGERSRDAVSVGDLLPLGSAAADGGEGEGAGERVGEVEGSGRDADCPGVEVLSRGGLPPGLPAEASGWVYVPLLEGVRA